VEQGALGIERVAGKDRVGRLHLVPAEIGDDLGADRANAHSGQKREGEGRVDQHLLPLGLGGVGRVEMHLLDIEGQQGEVGVVDVEHGATGAMLEHVAGFEILPVEARGFAIAAFADSFVGRQDGVHCSVSFSGGEYCGWAALGRRPSRGESAARFPRNGFVDHLAADCAHALGVLGQDGACLLYGFLSGRQPDIDRGDLAGMDGGLSSEAEGDRTNRLLLQALCVMDVEIRGIDRRHAGQGAGCNQPGTNEGQRLPGGCYAEIGGHVGGAQHEAGEPRRRRSDCLDASEPTCALDDADELRLL
jgi:hypothetical protein